MLHLLLFLGKLFFCANFSGSPTEEVDVKWNEVRIVQGF